MFELIRALGLYNHLPALILSYMIFTLPFTVWVLTTFMRELPKELEEAAIVDGAKPYTIVTKVFMPLMGPALATTGLLAFIAAWNEFLFALTFTLSSEQRTVPVAIALISGASLLRAALGQHHGRLGDRDRSLDRPGPDLPTPDRLRPDRRGGQGVAPTFRFRRSMHRLSRAPSICGRIGLRRGLSMASRIKEAAKPLYEDDFYVWARNRRAVRAGAI